MSLADLMSGDLSDDDSEDDEDFDPTAPPEDAVAPADFSKTADSSNTATTNGSSARFGVPYEMGDSDEEIDEDGEVDEGKERVISDEILFSHERFFSPRLRDLLHGTLLGGDPASRTGLLTGVYPMLLHQTQSPHPERPARIVAIYHEIIEQRLDARCKLVPVRAASEADLALVHTREQVAKATAVYREDEKASAALGLDSDSYFAAADSGRAALLSAGSVVELATRVCHGELRNALSVTRPPGHHCEHHQAMGFCMLNNVCVAAAVARRQHGISRVMIVDWDVHHGNGVQHIFEEDPNVLYVSTHRFGEGFYPGTGHPSHVGVGAGVGTSVNVAFSGTEYGDTEYLAAFDRIIMPIAREYGPDLVLVSAGFDAAAGDPLGGMLVSPAGYAHMTAMLQTLAGGKIVVALEGGYNLRSISRSAAACLSVLLGEPAPQIARGAPKPQAMRDIEDALVALRPHWKVLQPPPPSLEERAMRRKRQLKLKRLRGPWWYRYL